ncbi:hypothetical protein C8024_02580 [Sphingopyxis sp. BSNA05]|uniref:hypothetical protein n=1 Tax=Sphingopyxis sp. BSNA05 TaxID=1236614 RepID=UPI001565BC45|nr:hypothetical protein [Sphingopyxis sp. BSNA05]NRD88587.1 hypothetical protein [Sphingopyxis sp. BSNA05]
MIIIRSLLIALLALSGTSILAQANAGSSTEDQALQLALDRGFDLYRYDQAAWHTTDAMREDIEDLDGSGIRGWVVTNVETGLLVTFWKPEGDRLQGVYSAVWGDGKVSDRRILAGKEAELSAKQIELIDASRAIDASALERCSKSPFNLVTLPPAKAGDPILVYLLTPQTSHFNIPLGGHYRFAVENGKVIDQRQFMTSCFALPVAGEPGQEAVAIAVSHVLDPVPTEIHIFSAFAARMPIYVITTQNKFQWVADVSEGRPRVRKMDQKQ